jgi:ATP-dependent RNA helicase RhlE
MHLVKRENLRQALVFTRTRHGADRLVKQLTRRNIHAVAIHGNKTQSARTRALANFKQGKIRLLVATDIAARGLDINGLPHVVNYDIPQVAEDYVHRIGRTGRAGLNGTAISLVTMDEGPQLSAIEAVLRQRIPLDVIEGFTEEHKPQPRVKGSSVSQPRPPARSKPRSRAGRRPDRRRQLAFR